MNNNLEIRPFQPGDQQTAQQLILAGLTEHWGTLDPTLNPDLDDIAASYAHGTFLVAVLDGEVVGTGAILPENENGRIVRMSVAKEKRRQGIANVILNALIQIAQENQYQQILLETTATWQDAVTFYQRSGFTITHHADGDTHFIRPIYS